MPCVDLNQPGREGILQKIKASIEDPAIPNTNRKQFEVLQDLLKDPEEPTIQYIIAPFQNLPRGDDPKSIFGLSHPDSSSVLSFRSVTLFPEAPYTSNLPIHKTC